MGSKEFGLYKYVYPGKGIIYVGLSTNSIANRIYGHSREDKFKPFLDRAKIYYCHTPNKAVTEAYEKLLIDKYKPLLNVKDKYEGSSCRWNFEEPEWIPVDTKKASIVSTKPSYFDRYKRICEIIKEFKPEDDGYDNQENLFMEYRANVIGRVVFEDYFDDIKESILKGE